MKRLNQRITLLLSFLITVSCFAQLMEQIEPLVVNFTSEKIKAGGIRSVVFMLNSERKCYVDKPPLKEKRPIGYLEELRSREKKEEQK